MIAVASELHPLGKSLPDGDLSLLLKQAACKNETVVVEATYKPYRSWDVKKQRSLHLIDSVWRIGSRDVLSVQREESHTTHFTVTATGTTLSFVVPLRDPTEGYQRYQLASLRVDRLYFKTWFSEPPSLDPQFGLSAESDALRGELRRGGLGAEPLRGSLPLWPGLRTVELRVSLAKAPTVRLWDSMAKHHWDGWRQAIPQRWPGGRSIVARHVSGSTVWRTHEYFGYPPAKAAPVTQPEPPSGVIVGVEMEIFWPDAASHEFPEAYFERPASVLPIRVARLTPRARELLAQSATQRPGLEINSLSATEWGELDALCSGETITHPVLWEMRKQDGDKSLLVATRRDLTEPWVYLFGVEYDSDRRFALNALYVTPTAWKEALPE